MSAGLSRPWVPALLWLAPEQGALLHDDRVGRALDGLFDADRRALLTNLVVHMVKEFQVSLTQLHKDSTSLTLHGTYDGATGKLVRGQPTLVVTFGHSKDHHPDLKQLLWILTVSADGAVPVHVKVADGNTEDSTTHVETREVLRGLVGSPHFLYVADSTLCTRETLKHTHRVATQAPLVPRRLSEGLPEPVNRARQWGRESGPQPAESGTICPVAPTIPGKLTNTSRRVMAYSSVPCNSACISCRCRKGRADCARCCVWPFALP